MVGARGLRAVDDGEHQERTQEYQVNADEPGEERGFEAQLVAPLAESKRGVDLSQSDQPHHSAATPVPIWQATPVPPSPQ